MLHLALPLLLAGLAHADEALRARVVDMLSGMDSAPDAAHWLALGAGAGAELEAVAADRTMLPTQRGNAMIALANFPTESAAALLRGAAADPAENPLVRRKALGGLARGWQAAALPALTTALADDDTLLRVAAVRALAALPGGEGAAALRARLLVETDPTVLAELRKGVSP